MVECLSARMSSAPEGTEGRERVGHPPGRSDDRMSGRAAISFAARALELAPAAGPDSSTFTN